MKKGIITIILIVASLGMTWAQKGERIKSMKIAVFTEQLNLTPQEAQQFWPIYNEMEAELKQVRKDSPKIKVIETDAEADAVLKQYFGKQERKLAIERKYYAKFRQVLPIQKVAKINRAEKAFKKRLLKLKERRQNGPQKGRRGSKGGGRK